MPAAPPGLRIGVSNGAVPAAALAAIRPARSVAFLSGVPADHQAPGRQSATNATREAISREKVYEASPS